MSPAFWLFWLNFPYFFHVCSCLSNCFSMIRTHAELSVRCPASQWTFWTAHDFWHQKFTKCWILAQDLTSISPWSLFFNGWAYLRVWTILWDTPQCVQQHSSQTCHLGIFRLKSQSSWQVVKPVFLRIQESYIWGFGIFFPNNYVFGKVKGLQ